MEGGTSARSRGREIAEGLQIEFVKLAWRGSLSSEVAAPPDAAPYFRKLLGRRAKLRPG